MAGLAGVGKTELVVQTATRALREPDWFPGGVLFVDLLGYDPERSLAPERALDGLLRALAMPPEHIPTQLQDLSRLYRSVLSAFADQGRRILVIIDNASSEDQARPLLPTDGTTCALVTSRDTLDLDARLHDLDVLTGTASVALLAQALQHAHGPTDTRVHDAPEHAATIATLCAGLPLALRIVAALLADSPTRPLSSIAQALSDEHTRLKRLRRKDRAVRAAFDLSYRRLTDQQARLFRLLPLNPGPDISTEAATHLAAADPYETEELLQDLALTHLIHAAPTWGRWRFHDLVRLYANDLGHAHATTDHRADALTALLSHYLTTTEAATTHLKSLPSPTSPRFTNRTDALTWLGEERLNLIATVTTADALGRPRTAVSLAFLLGRFLHFRRYFKDLVTVAATAVTVSRDLGDQPVLALALNDLGDALSEVRQFDEAIEAHTEAVAIFREFGDREGQGRALLYLGAALREARRFDEAIEAHTRDLAVCGELGDRQGEGIAWGALGLTFTAARRFDEAIDAHTRAAAIHRELGDRNSEAAALNNLGSARQEVRRFDEAIDAHTRAAALFHELGDQDGEGAALNNLGVALRKAHRFDEAIEVHARDLAISRELEDFHRLAITLDNLGIVLQSVDRFDEAVKAHIEAATIHQAFDNWQGEGTALNNLGPALRAVGRFDEAVYALTRAVAIHQALNDHHREAMALNNLGGALQSLRRFAGAIDAHGRAAITHRRLGDHHREAMALNNLGVALRAVGRFDEAIEALTQAAAIHRELGDPYGEGQAVWNIAAVHNTRWLRQQFRTRPHSAP
ncbi:tetratricopeptide repeat protein [Kitasatospora acidiphila]|nr:tetratricopeptide repeat protein [Kitasatospora acidiphila]